VANLVRENGIKRIYKGGTDLGQKSSRARGQSNPSGGRKDLKRWDKHQREREEKKVSIHFLGEKLRATLGGAS